jgi:hypothetical protein
MLSLDGLVDMITGVCSLIQYVQELREKVEFYLFIHAVLGWTFVNDRNGSFDRLS